LTLKIESTAKKKVGITTYNKKVILIPKIFGCIRLIYFIPHSGSCKGASSQSGDIEKGKLSY